MPLFLCPATATGTYNLTSIGVLRVTALRFGDYSTERPLMLVAQPFPLTVEAFLRTFPC
jgi:hypothetical protein